MAQEKVLLVIASEGYQQVEYNEPKKVLETAGFTVVTASNKPEAAIAKDGSTTKVDVVLDYVNINDYRGIFFIGGPGALENLDNATSYGLIKSAAQADMPFGAICVSTRILAKAGTLKDKRATGWDGDNELGGVYKEHGVTYVPEDVVVDGNVITATGPTVAKKFGQQVVAVLQNYKGSWG